MNTSRLLTRDSGIGNYYLGYVQLLNSSYEESIESFNTAIAVKPRIKASESLLPGSKLTTRLFKYQKSRQKFLEVQANSAQKAINSAFRLRNTWIYFACSVKNIMQTFLSVTSTILTWGLEPDNVQIFTDEKDSSLYLFSQSRL